MFTTLNMIRDRLLAPAPVVVPPPVPVQAIQVPDPGITFLDEGIRFGEVKVIAVENKLQEQFKADHAARLGESIPVGVTRQKKIDTLLQKYNIGLGSARVADVRNMLESILPDDPAPTKAKSILTDDDVKVIRERQKTDRFTLSLVGRKPAPDKVNLELMFTDVSGTFTKWIAQYRDVCEWETQDRTYYQVAKGVARSNYVDNLLLTILLRMHDRFNAKRSDRGQAWLLPVVDWFCAPPAVDVGLPWCHEAIAPDVNIASHLDDFAKGRDWRSSLRLIIVDLGINQLPAVHGNDRWYQA